MDELTAYDRLGIFERADPALRTVAAQAIIAELQKHRYREPNSGAFIESYTIDGTFNATVYTVQLCVIVYWPNDEGPPRQNKCYVHVRFVLP